MKKCPTCEKTFDDAMRFCQTDGTPLVTVGEESQPEDPLKTTVVRQDEIASSIPPSDPFQTMVGSPAARDEEDDLLQLPEEMDPMKTMVVPPLGAQNRSNAEPPGEEIELDVPPPSFGAPPAPGQAQTEDEDFGAATVFQPEPPRFDEPRTSPPSLSDFPPKEEAPPVSEPSSFPTFNEPSSSTESAEPRAATGDSPFERPEGGAIPSPFGSTPKSPFEQPASPFEQPGQSPFQTPSFNEPEPALKQDEPLFGGSQPKPFEEPQQAPFGQNDPFNQPLGSQPMQPAEWTPPPSPVASWQDQGLGADTPFQPPVAMQGQNQTLPIVSLVFGILSLCCYIAPITGLVALITGYMGIKNVNRDPNQFGGKGLAIAGMVTGGIFLAVGLLYWLYIIFIIGAVGFGAFSGL